MLVTLYTPAYNEVRNLPVLYEKLKRVMDGIGANWEWIVVDDHSADGTFREIEKLASIDGRVHGIRLSRNFGSHAARTCALQHARGDCAIALVADLQYPLELIPGMINRWQQGAQLVLGVRGRRPGETKLTIWTSALFRWLLRTLSQLHEEETSAAGFSLMDRRVVDAFLQFPERNVNVLTLAVCMGFRQSRIHYDQQPRMHGRSGWTLRKKVRLAIDSLTGFSNAPLQLAWAHGFPVPGSGQCSGARGGGWSVPNCCRRHLGGCALGRVAGWGMPDADDRSRG